LPRMVKSLHRANVVGAASFQLQVFLSAAVPEVNHGEPTA